MHDEEIHKLFKNELDHQLDDFPHAIAGTNNKKELRKMKQYKLSNIFLWIKKYDFFFFNSIIERGDLNPRCLI